MTDQTHTNGKRGCSPLRAFSWPRGGQPAAGSATYATTLILLLALVLVYVLTHAWTLQRARYVHSEGTTVDAERMALLLGTAQLGDELSTPPAIAAPAVQAVLGSLEESVIAATTPETVTVLFAGAVERLVDLGIPEDGTQQSRDSATARIGHFLSRAEAQAQELVAASPGSRDVPRRLLEIELEQAEAAVVSYMAAPAVIDRVNELKEAARGLGYGADSEVITALTHIGEELDKDRPNRELAAEMLSRIEDQVQGMRTSVFWSNTVLRWVEVIAWSLAGILGARLVSAGKYIGTGQYKPEWDRWWWAKVVLAPIMAVPVVAFLTYLTIDVQSGETLGISLSLKDQPVEVVIGFSLVIGMFSNQAYKFLQNMANKILPEEDATEERDSSRLVVEEIAIKGRSVDEVKAELEARGFRVQVETRETGEAAPGIVLERRPAYERMKKGSSITLVVAAAPPATP